MSDTNNDRQADAPQAPESLMSTTQLQQSHRALCYTVAMRRPGTVLFMVAFVAVIAAVASGHALWLTNKTVAAMTFLLLCGTLGTFLFRRLPPAWRLGLGREIRSDFPASVQWQSRCTYVLDQLRPFFYGATFIAQAPIALTCTVVDWCLSRFKPETDTAIGQIATKQGKIVLRQNIPKQSADQEQPFYMTQAFSLTLLAIACFGIPAAITLMLFTSLGLDALYLYPTKAAAWPAASFVFFQLTGFGCCAFPLLFRAMVLLPEKHTSWESAIEIDHTGVRKGNIKGWFADLALYTVFSELFPWHVQWHEIERVQYVQAGFGRMSPLPNTLFASTPEVHKTLAPLAELNDAIVDKLGRAEWIVLRKHNDVDFAPGLRIQLWDLNEHDRAVLFYAIRRWAPNAIVDDEAQRVLLGGRAIAKTTEQSSVFWQNLLTDTQIDRHEGLLAAGDAIYGGRYKIKSHIATGGQANVYLADDTTNGATVVLKEYMLTNSSATRDLIGSAELFENETSLLSRIQHPGIVQMYEMFSHSGRAYIVMEHVTGSSLAELIRNGGPIAVDRVFEIAKQLCDVLEHLHGQTPPIVHRDLTPANIMVSDDATIKLIDFSVAVSAQQSTSVKTSGKRAYMPPEQFRGEISQACDIYALGCVLYFMATGKDPIPLSQSSIGSNVSPALDRVIQGCTRLEADDRYESISWIKLDLS